MSEDESERSEEGNWDTLEARLRGMLAPDDSSGNGARDAVGATRANLPFEVGPFQVDEFLGRGGSANVYGGRHRETGVEVAVKVVEGPVGVDARRRFHREVQSHARLLHPGVVYLFEYGDVVGSDAGRPSRQEEQVGADEAGARPFVAMERGDAGTVREHMPVSNWEEVRSVLVQVLDALAYAHARGVIHRDLKPENLLVFEGDEKRRRVKLADFGIAHAFQQERETDSERMESAAGTPLYMAPEQFEGRWRTFGPWTDLYALGCMTWELVCGRPPFRGDSVLAIAGSHQADERPPLDSRFPVPSELQRWIHRAMAVEPEGRFRRAADALWALPRAAAGSSSAGGRREPEKATGHSADPPASESIELETLQTIVIEGEVDSLSRAETLPAEEVSEAASRGAPRVPDAPTKKLQPPVPDDWRPEQTDSPPAPLVGTGLRLFGLREPPFVDRRRECDAIWKALREVVRPGTHRLAFVTGEAGTGKSRLAEWMATRAHEVGAARVLRATHTEDGSPSDGLQGALERTLRTVKLDRGEVFEHLREMLPPLERDEWDGDWRERDARALTEYLRPTDDEEESVDGPRYRFSSRDQKLGLLVRVLRRLSSRRPVLLWLDDLQWGQEAISLLEHVLATVEERPKLLVVTTVRSDALWDEPRTKDRLEDLAAAEASLRVPLDPLSAADQRKLVEGLLPLEDDLVDDLAERTEGHPLFAMQLLGHWIESGDIAVGPEGFRVPEGRELELPEDIHSLWMERIERLTEDYAVAARALWEALELAAALGREVIEVEWRAVMEIADVPAPAGLVDQLVERGLAERTSEGWSFAHGLLVDSLGRRAREGGRWSEHHRACAQMLGDRASEARDPTAVRRADHWVVAGELERALEPLKAAARRRRRVGDLEELRRVLERRETLFEALDVPEDDPGRLDNAVELGRCRRELGGAPRSILEEMERVIERADRENQPEVEAKACDEAAACLRELGELDRAHDYVTRGAERIREVERPKPAARVLQSLGRIEYFRGDFELAATLISDACRRAVEANDRYLEALSRRHLALVVYARKDPDRAEKLYEEVLEETRACGYRGLRAGCLNGLGDLTRLKGRASDAVSYYRRARALDRELGRPGHAVVGSLNLGQVELMNGQFESAAETIADAEQRLEELSRRGEFTHLLRFMRMAWAAGIEDWSEVDRILAFYDDGFAEDAGFVKDHPWLLEMAGDDAADAGEMERAREVFELSHALWSRLGEEENAERVDAKRATLD